MRDSVNNVSAVCCHALTISLRATNVRSLVDKMTKEINVWLTDRTDGSNVLILFRIFIVQFVIGIYQCEGSNVPVSNFEESNTIYIPFVPEKMTFILSVFLFARIYQ